MSGYRLPAPAGLWLQRDRPQHIVFNGRRVEALAGDSVASALLAAGITMIGRSYKLHRPRGVWACGVEEPTGLLDIGSGARRTPDTRASDVEASPGLVATTGNAWPTLGFDVGALAARVAGLLPAGFYYKTLMWPGWHCFEPLVRAAAGLGHAPAADAGADPDCYDEVSRPVEVLVVGGGAAGLSAALAAAEAGHEVLLVEAAQHVGGWALTTTGDAAARVAELCERLRRSRVTVLTRCTVLGLYDHRLAVAVEQVDGSVRERLWKLRAQRIVLATGAIERPMLFPDNDRPGVMLASAVLRHAALYGVACGRRVVVATACDSGYETARELLAWGVEVVAIVDHRAQAGCAAPAGVALHRGSAIVAVQGRRAVQGLRVCSHDGQRHAVLAADCVASAGGWTPAVHLYSMAGGRLRWDEAASTFVPAQALEGIAVVGACAGAFDFDAALLHAARVGVNGANEANQAPVGGLGLVPADLRPGTAALQALGRRPGTMFVDLQNDVSTDDIALAARENYRSVEHLKRYTTLGMATDQGKTSNVNGLVLMGRHTGRPPGEVGTTRFRPPYRPVTLNAIAAGRSGARIKPLRRMPGHHWHAAQGALFEEFGGWLRPAAYPRPGETLQAAAGREALQVRRAVGLFEGSPLGKIEVYGPDAAAFLDLMYVGTMSTLAIGAARYGLLLNENGVIVDDGIVARLGEHHFWVNTTSGGAERVALAFEEWLQCEFVSLRVLVTPVTSDWGNVTISGPKAWALLQAAGFEPGLAPSVMKHMTLRESTLDGVAMRVLRASFSGELGYEINLPALHTADLLARLAQAGAALGVAPGLAPYGIEALMVLRTEKGYLHVGADTDGTTLPGDVGMDRGVAAKKAAFVGRRSLSRPAARDPQRLQLVGLLPLDRRSRLPVGAHVCAQRPPAAAEGHVTSSCCSPVLGHPVALALLRRGRARTGERITVWHLGTATEAEVVALPFYDAAGARLHGA